MANLIDNDALDLGLTEAGWGQPGAVMNASIASFFVAQVNSTGNLEVYKSSDDGLSWSLDTTFIDSTSIKVFSFADSPRGDIFLAFSYATATDVYTIKVKKRDYSTGTWSEILSETALDCTTIPLKPFIAWNRYESNRLHVFWMEHASAGSSGDIYNKYSDNYGSSWTNGSSYPYSVSYGNFDYTIDSIDTSPTDGKVVVYHRIVGVSIPLSEQEFSSVGLVGSNTFLPNTLNRNHLGSSAVIDSSNNRWVLLYYYYATTGLYTLEVIDRTGTDDITIMSAGTPQIYSSNLAIGADTDGNIYVLYTKTADDKCYYRKYNLATTTWEAEVTLTTGEGLRPSCVQHQPSGSSRLLTTFYTN